MKDIREFLAQLSKELQRSEDFDIEARQILDELHKDVISSKSPVKDRSDQRWIESKHWKQDSHRNTPRWNASCASSRTRWRRWGYRAG